MKKQRRLWCLTALLCTSAYFLTGMSANVAEANNTPQTLPYTQNWTTNLITVNDDWAPVNGVVGYLGDITSTTQANIDARTIIQPFSNVDVIANLANATSTTGGVGEFDGITNPTIGFQGSGTADAPNVVIFLNTTGQNNVRVAFNARDIDDTADDAVQQINVQYRIGSTGDFINVPGGYVADATTGPSQATLVTPVSVTLPVAANNQPVVEVRIMTMNAGGSDEWVGIDDIVVDTNPLGNARNRTNLDINGDGKTDYAIARGTLPDGPATSWININGTDQIVGVQFGLMSDYAVPEDYDGDGKDDIAVWRPGTQGVFYIVESATGTLRIDNFGQTGDMPQVVGDYDGDGKADVAVYRPGATGFYYYRGSLNNPGGSITFVPFGDAAAVPVPGDYDGDGKYDFCVKRPDPAAPANGQFVLLRSQDFGVEYVNWGLVDDLAVPGDYDGDGRSDFCVGRAPLGVGNWYILERDGGGTGANPISFGSLLTDIPAFGDYDGDGRTDIAIWRNGVFWVRNSAFGNAVRAQQWGQPADAPLAGWNVAGLDF